MIKGYFHKGRSLNSKWIFLELETVKRLGYLNQYHCKHTNYELNSLDQKVNINNHVWCMEDECWTTMCVPFPFIIINYIIRMHSYFYSQMGLKTDTKMVRIEIFVQQTNIARFIIMYFVISNEKHRHIL